MPRTRAESRIKLEAHINKIINDQKWPVEKPLPTTRELAASFKVSATTAYRLLHALAVSAKLWQHPSGRFYLPGARALLDRPQPVACLIRRMEMCSALYRELLEGISRGCGEAHRTMLLWHDEVLVNHPDASRPPIFGSISAQQVILNDFLERHGASAGGFILDHLWSDEVLRHMGKNVLPGVVLFRRCELPGLGNVYADLAAGATAGLAHLLSRGYTEIVPILPFDGDSAVQQFFAALSGAARQLGCSEQLKPRALARTPEERASLVAGLSRRGRVALLTPEDNVALQLHRELSQQGRRCPDEVGILSVMGTAEAARCGLSRVYYDFNGIGRTAIQILVEGSARSVAFSPLLIADRTT